MADFGKASCMFRAYSPQLITLCAAMAVVPTPLALAAQPENLRGRHAEMLPFRSLPDRAACLRHLPQLQHVCTPDRLGRPYHMEVVIADLDRDRRRDVVIRYLSLLDCGSHGCATELYRGVAGRRLVKSQLNVVSTGAVLRCRRGSYLGIAFSGSRNRHCFLMR